MSFETPKAEREPERIVRKALRLGDKIYQADNHVLAFDALQADNPEFNPDEELHQVDYGFVTNQERFVYADEVTDELLGKT